MPYKGHELLLFILLPRQRDGLLDMEKSLTGKNFLEAMLGAYYSQLEKVSIPKFNFEEGVDLVRMLKTLGATDMFDKDKADFSGINGRRNLLITDAVQKAFVEVNEEGTEAAASTFMNAVFAGPMEMPSFVADHPFLFAILDTRSASILFVGRYFGK